MSIDDKLSFKTHIENICRKAKYKLHALQRIRKYLSTDKAKTLCFYKQPVLLCAINLDVCREIVNLKSTKIHFWSLQVFRNTYYTTYDELLSMNSDVSIHQR